MENGCAVGFAKMLSYFHNDNCKGMERTLMLDACCSTENIECEKNELAAGLCYSLFKKLVKKTSSSKHA